MKSQGVKPDVVTYSVLHNARKPQGNSIDSVLELMKEDGLEPDIYTLNASTVFFQYQKPTTNI
jgi:hypothetical protein